MRFSLLAALAAATALIPAAASAQHHDRGGWQSGGDHADRGGDRGTATPRPAPPARITNDRGAGAAPRFQGGARPQFDRGRLDRPNEAQRPQQFGRADGGRPAQVRPDGNWRAQAGGSHFGDRAGWNRDGGPQRRWDRGPAGRPGAQWDGRRGGPRGGFDRNWRHDNRYDWHDYRVRHRSAYHLPRYYAPYGWDYGYRRFGIGFRLDSILFGSNYWISDPYDYRLPPAYGPYRWVRYYNDALLVDMETGEVVDVVYDIFW